MFSQNEFLQDVSQEFLAASDLYKTSTHQAAAIAKCKKLRWVCGCQILNRDIKSNQWKVKLKSHGTFFIFLANALF